MAGGPALLQAPRFDVRHSVIDRSGGASIAVYDYGPVDGDPVVLVHGFASVPGTGIRRSMVWPIDTG
jgi:pimeloyl-ACP methyl ester carboxylesterase